MLKNRFGGLRKKIAVMTSVLLVLQGVISGVLLNPAKAEANTKVYALTTEVVINEIMPNGVNNPSESDEFIELYNTGSTDIDLTDWTLTDLSGTPIYTLSETILAGGFVLKTRAQTGIAQNNDGDTVYLKDDTAAIVDSVAYPSASSHEGHSYARKPNGDINWLWDYTPTPDDTNAPEAPTLSLPADNFLFNTDNVDLSWLQVEDIVGGTITYDIQLIGSTTQNFTGITDTSYSLPSLADGIYSWKVRSNNVYETGMWSGARSFIVDTGEPISEAKIDKDYQTTKTFDVKYTSSDVGSGVDYVELYYKAPGSASYVKYTTLANTQGKWTTSPISFTATIDGEYSFYTKAYDLAGNEEILGLPGTFCDDKTIVDTIAPSPLLNVAVTPGDGKVTLTWSASVAALSISDIVGYAIVWGPPTNPRGYIVDVGNVTTHTITGLQNGVVYYFVVLAYDKAGNMSNMNSSKLLIATPVAAVSAPIAALVSPAYAASTEVTLPAEEVTQAPKEEIKGEEVAIDEGAEDKKEEEEKEEERKTPIWGIIILIILIAAGGYLYFAQSEEGGFPKFPKLPKLPWKR